MYCYQVVKVIPSDKEGPEQWWCKRYGYADGQPVKDGHQDIHYLNGLKSILPGIWKDEWEFDTPRWSCCPLYYRQMNTDIGGQGSLF